MENLRKLTIRQFVINTQKKQRDRYKAQTAAEAVLGKVPLNPRNWTQQFLRAGYHRVIPKIDKWSEMHEWLQANIGRDHYSWNGENFWFETKQDATLFALRWA